MRWLAVVLYIGVIFALSSIRRPPPGPDIPQYDKLLHIAEYGILGLLLVRALLGSGVKSATGAAGSWWRRIAVPAIAVAAVIATADELYQLTVPGRVSSAADALADLAGVGLAVLVAVLIWKRRGAL